MNVKILNFYLYVVLMLFFSSTLNHFSNNKSLKPKILDATVAIAEKNIKEDITIKSQEIAQKDLNEKTIASSKKNISSNNSYRLTEKYKKEEPTKTSPGSNEINLFSSKPAQTYKNETPKREKAPSKELILASNQSTKNLKTDADETSTTSKKIRLPKDCSEIMQAYSKDICPKKVSLDFEYLLMNFFEDGLSYASILDDESIRTKNKQKFKSGARFSAEFKAYRSLYLDLAYTYIRMKNKDSIEASGDTILGTFFPPNIGSLTSASAKLTGNFNTWDLFFLKPYHVSKSFVSRPILGIRGAIINQSLKMLYDIASTTNPVNAKNEYWGVGLNTGYKSEFLITKNFIIDTKAVFSLLYGKTKISQNSSVPLLVHATYDLKETSYQVKPNAELGLGFSYSRYFTKNINRLSFRASYEFHEWWGQNQLKRFFSTDPTGIKTVSRNNLKFNGFTFSINIEI
ncbi:MAG: hypothetical protein K940chlam1_00153 [Candidatus Anoxychlamydiales bacterium]|nr:hypothetical protein [Candidatus Anoxychlamydiales bacterium]NGX35622.1 hypothetical protein [Candidatus Anoxychlamydiales bacterium]